MSFAGAEQLTDDERAEEHEDPRSARALDSLDRANAAVATSLILEELNHLGPAGRLWLQVVDLEGRLLWRRAEAAADALL